MRASCPATTASTRSITTASTRSISRSRSRGCIVGYERQQQPAAARLGGERAIAGLITGLFHDVGYLRRTDEGDSRNGAEFTRTHVTRGARFLADYLPDRGARGWVPIASQIVHFTGYEVPFDQIIVTDPRDLALGHMIGTADMIAQMADRCYLEKCRDRLYAEFVLGGVALPIAANGGLQVKYASGVDLLRQTPGIHLRGAQQTPRWRVSLRLPVSRNPI